MAVGGRVLGEAFVVISPDVSDFLSELTTKVKAAVSAVPAQNVKVGVDTSPVNAGLAALRTQLSTALAKAAELKITADDTGLAAKLAAIVARVAALQKALSSLKMDDPVGLTRVSAGVLRLTDDVNKLRAAFLKAADVGPMLGPVTRQMADLRSLAQQVSAALATLHVSADDTAMKAQLASLQAQAARLRAELADLPIGADPARIAELAAGFAKVNAQVDKMKGSLAGMAIGPPGQALSELRDKAAALSERLAAMDIGNIKGAAAFSARLTALQLQSDKLKATLADLSIGGDPMRLAEANLEIQRMAVSTEKLKSDVDTAGQSVGILTGWLSRFAAANQKIGWNAMIGGVQGWHILLDAAIEAVIILTGSVLALGAAFAVAYPAIDQMGIFLKASNSVMTAMHQNVGALTDQLGTLHKQMGPMVIEAYGGLLEIARKNMDVFGQSGARVVTMFDDWIARIDIWSKSQGNFGGLLKAGEGYLAQLGKAIGIIAMAIDNLLTKDPGIAHWLLDMIQGIAVLFLWFSKLPKPIVEVVLAGHGLYLWASVMTGVLSKLLSPLGQLFTLFLKLGGVNLAERLAGASGIFDKMKLAVTGLGEALLTLAANPVTWVILGLVALAAIVAGVVWSMHQGSAAAKQYLGNMNDQLATLKASDAIPQIVRDIGSLNAKIASVPSNIASIQATMGTAFGAPSVARVKANLTAMGDAAVGFKNVAVGVFTGDMTKAFGGFGTILHSFNAQHDAAMHQAANDVKAYQAQLQKLQDQYGTYMKETGDLVKSGHSVSEAWALMDLAGVKNSDSFDLMKQKVDNLISGYNAMAISGDILSNSVNALTFQTLQQDSKVTQLNSAWDTFFKTVSGGAQGFTAFAQQVNGLNEVLGGGTNSLTVSNGRANLSFRAAAQAAQSGTTTMTGLNDASLQARDTLLRTADAANSQMDSLTLLASAAGLGKKGTDLLAQANKDMLSQMLPAAAGSQQMTDVLYALAQRGGYKGADSFQKLSEWVGKTKDPMKNLDGITTTLTTDAANLTQDVKNLSDALGQNLNGAMAQAIITANGGQAIFTGFASAVLKTGVNSKATRDAGQQLAQSLVNMTGDTAQAKQLFETFAIAGLHMTKKQADDLWASFGKLTPAVKASGDTAGKAKTDFEKFAGDKTHGLGMSTQKADELWKKLQGDLGPVLADLANSKAPGAKQQFEKLAGDPTHGLGLTKQQADNLWNSLHGNLGQELASLAGPNSPALKSKAAFEAWAGDKTHGLGLTKEQADKLYTALGGGGKGGLLGAINGLHDKNVKITADTHQASSALDGILSKLGQIGKGLLGALGSATGSAVKSLIPGLGFHLQHGGLVTMGSGPHADDVHALLSKGEVVVPARMVNAGVVDHLRGSLPGFAGGGLVGYQGGGAVGGAAGGGIVGGSISALAQALNILSTQMQILFVSKIPAWMHNFAAVSRETFTKISASLQTVFTNVLQAMFTGKLPVWFTAAEAGFRKLWTQAATDFYNGLQAQMKTFFTNTVTAWLTNTTNAFKSAWDNTAHYFQNDLVSPVQQFFTNTIPQDLSGFDTRTRQTFDDVAQYFATKVNQPISSAISAWSGDIVNAFKSGWNQAASTFNSSVVTWINSNILKNLPGSLSIQQIPGFAGGGFVGMGTTPHADDVLARVSKGELVVPAHMVSAGAVDHLRGRLPGFGSGGPGYTQLAAGGLIPGYAAGAYVNPLGPGAVPSRIDMGVDYTGSFNVFALGKGQIMNVYSGWPGGVFISEKLADGQYAGALWYAAEHINPAVKVGQQVTAGQKIGFAPGGYPWTEFGFANSPSGQTMAAAAGQQNPHGDPGAFTTAYGVLASNLIASLGGPAGIPSGAVHGKVGGVVPSAVGGGIAVMWQTLEGLLNSAGSALSGATSKLAQYVQGGSKALLALANKGAQAVFDEVWKDSVAPKVKRLPQSTMVGAYIQDFAMLLNKGISGFMKAKDDAAKASAASMAAGVAATGAALGPGAAAAQSYAKGRLGAFGWDGSQWASLVSLWTGESGWSNIARNPSSGAYGIPQALPASKMGPAANPPTNSASAQVDWGMNYIKATYGSPNSAYSQWLARSPHWYDQGGILPPGMHLVMNGTGHNETIIPHDITSFASGGVAGYHQKLAGDQAAELRDYKAFVSAAKWSLTHAAAGSYLTRHHKSILDEMGTLSRRQAAETGAYKPVSAASLTTAEIGHFITAIDNMVTTTRDVALGHLPGGSLGTLRNLLLAMAKAAAAEPSLPGTAPTVAGGNFPSSWKTPAGWAVPSGTIALADFWSQLKAEEKTEKQYYANVAAGFKKSMAAAKATDWAFIHRNMIGSELTTLALRQNQEISAYSELMLRSGNQPVANALSKFATSLKTMATTVKDADLSHVPGGHPALMQGLYTELGNLYEIAGKRIGDPVTPFSLFTTPALPKPGTPAYITLAGIYGWYDRGGVLPPGLTLAWNGTGRNEVVSPVPPGGVIGPGGMSHGEMQIIHRLDRLIAMTSTAPAAYSAALNGVAGTAASRGYYGPAR
jgi:hypothetical protein